MIEFNVGEITMKNNFAKIIIMAVVAVLLPIVPCYAAKPLWQLKAEAEKAEKAAIAAAKAAEKAARQDSIAASKAKDKKESILTHIWDGKIDSEWYWENPERTEFTISTVAQFAGLAQLVNGGNDFAGKTIKLTVSIMLNDTSGWRNWEKFMPANTWTAIGSYTDENNSRPFSGTFDGGGNVIGGVYINISGDYQGLFGYANSSATLKNIGVVASYINARDGNYVGGLVGWNSGTITNCHATGVVSSKFRGGGLVGGNIGGSITNSYATVAVGRAGSTSGGLVGVNGSDNMPKSTITNSYATGDVSGGGGGGLVGWNYGTITNSYAMGDVSGGGGGGLVGWNYGSITNSYATGYLKSGGGGLVEENSGTIMNSYATGNVSGSNHAGGLVGDNKNEGTIENSYATGNISGKFSGGLVGSNDGTITNCYAMGYVKGKIDSRYSYNYSTGGLVGWNSGTITNCYATGNVVSSENAGGLVGKNYGIIIENSYAMGNVTSDKIAGGLVGENRGIITSCYAMGNIIGNASGGLVGWNKNENESENKSTIKNSYSTGIVNGTSNTNGGLVGSNEGGTIVNSYYDRQASGQSDIVKKGEPKSTAQMKQQAIFQGWDFDMVWKIDESKNNGYPYLQSSEKSLPAKYKYPNKAQQGNTLTDKRDGKKYKTVIINTQTWMAENLNYDAKGSRCYDNKPANCAKYGRLYNWATSLKACPAGWHLPSYEEWEELINYADMSFDGPDIYLRATDGWSKGKDYDENGTDYFGFAALPGGKGNSDGKSFTAILGYWSEYGGYWWSSTYKDSNNAYIWSIYYGSSMWPGRRSKGSYSWYTANKPDLFSIRCLQD